MSEQTNLRQLRRRLSEYPQRIMEVQRLYESLPDLSELTVTMPERTDAAALRGPIRNLMQSLRSYEITLKAILQKYRHIEADLEEDTARLGQAAGREEEFGSGRPEGERGSNPMAEASLRTDRLAADQYRVLLQMQIRTVQTQLDTIGQSLTALGMAMQQQDTAAAAAALEMLEKIRKLKNSD